MTDNNLFGDNFNDDAISSIDPTKDYYSEYVGDGKKFKDEKELAVAKAQSDAFIERLKQEMAGLRQELGKRVDEDATRARLDEVLTKITELSNKSTSNNGNLPVDTGTTTNTANSLKPEDLEKLVNDALNKTLSEKQKQENFNSVLEAAKNKYGENYASTLRKQANELGLDEAKMNELATSSPKAFMKLLGIEETTNNFEGFTPPKSQVNQTFKPRVGNEKTYSYYEEMRVKEPKKFWSPQIQNERHEQALKLGERFFDAD